jgi:hypothetical protein
VVDPFTASLVATGFTSHMERGTASSYATGVRKYVSFCQIRDLDPWPVDEIVFCAWIHVLCRSVLTTSMGSYLAGVRDYHILHWGKWLLEGNEAVRRTKIYVRKLYPSNPVAPKFQVTLAVLLRLCPCLPGWPVLQSLSDNDLVFLTASVTATCAFLRGGEFTTSKGSSRPVLMRTNVRIRNTSNAGEGGLALVVFVPSPKTRKDLSGVDVPCFEGAPGNPLSPLLLWSELVRRFPVPVSLEASFPAFPVDNAPMSRAYMVSRTTELLALAGLQAVDCVGNAVDIRAASWRAGGVQSAYDAGVSESLIMALGRWKSGAWRHYLVLSPSNFRAAAHRMWASANDVAVVTARNRVVCVGFRPSTSHVKKMLMADLSDVSSVAGPLRKKRRVRLLSGFGRVE